MREHLETKIGNLLARSFVMAVVVVSHGVQFIKEVKEIAADYAESGNQ